MSGLHKSQFATNPKVDVLCDRPNSRVGEIEDGEVTLQVGGRVGHRMALHDFRRHKVERQVEWLKKRLVGENLGANVLANGAIHARQQVAGAAVEHRVPPKIERPRNHRAVR